MCVHMLRSVGVCVCACVRVDMHRSAQRSTSGGTPHAPSTLGFGKRPFMGIFHGAHKPPACASLVFGLQVCASMFNCFTWVLGLKLTLQTELSLWLSGWPQMADFRLCIFTIVHSCRECHFLQSLL